MGVEIFVGVRLAQCRAAEAFGWLGAAAAPRGCGCGCGHRGEGEAGLGAWRFLQISVGCGACGRVGDEEIGWWCLVREGNGEGAAAGRASDGPKLAAPCCSLGRKDQVYYLGLV
uniref:Uncharacterized protein n=1 Tax=Oryza meridionalis TaxID=40149 RepID=A0A0E0CQX6_9ORYZ